MIAYRLLLFLALTYGLGASSLDTIYEWKFLNISQAPVKQRVQGSVRDGVYHIEKIYSYTSDAYFNYKKAVPFDVDESKDGRVFVTIVGKPDVNVTLATITNVTAHHGPILEPYPDHTWFLNRADCSKMISVRSVTIDKCNRLWVLDSGRVDTTQLCNAKLLVFDLNNDKLLERHEMTRDISENSKGRGVLVNPVVKTEGATCEKTNVYIADSEGYALVLFDGKEFVRLGGREYGPVPTEMTFTIANESFRLPGGIVPMDLEPSGQRLTFAPLASRDISILSTNELANAFKPGTHQQARPIVGKGVFTSQPTAFKWSRKNVLFFGKADSSIGCWRRRENFCSDNFDTVISDTERLQYISALKVIPQSESNSEEKLLVLSNRLQKSIKRNRSFDEINYRILKGEVNKLLERTNCENNVIPLTCDGIFYPAVKLVDNILDN